MEETSADYLTPDLSYHSRKEGGNKGEDNQWDEEPITAKVPHNGGNRDVDDGQGTLRLGKVFLVACLLDKSNRVGFKNILRSIRAG